MPVSLVLVFLPLAAALTQTQTDEHCNAPQPCTRAKEEACCGKTPKEYPSYTTGDTACGCIAHGTSMQQAKIDTQCGALMLMPDCSKKATDCCKLSPKQTESSSSDGSCCCVAADSGAKSKCDPPGPLTQAQTDGICNAPKPCTRAKKEACCGKTPKEYAGGTPCDCIAHGATFGQTKIEQTMIDTDCADLMSTPDCSKKQTECCTLSPKQKESQSSDGSCCCVAADSGAESKCDSSVSARRLGGGGAAVGFGALGLAFLLA